MSHGFTVNAVFLTGNLTRDPEVKFLPSGIAVANFSLAVNNRKKSGDEWVDDTCFVDVVVYGKTAEQVGADLDKGMPVMVEGELKYRSWEKDGQKRSKLEVQASNVKPLVKFQGAGSKRSEADDSDGLGGGVASRRGGKPDRDDDVPF